MIEAALANGRITKNGAWCSKGNQRLGQGRSAACRCLADNPELRERLITECTGPVLVGGGADAPSKPAKESGKDSKSKAVA